MRPKCGWRLSSPLHHIFPERCYLGLGLGKGQLTLKMFGFQTPLNLVGRGEERLKHCLLPGRIPHKVS